MSIANPKKFTNTKMNALAQWLINAQGGPESFDPENTEANPVYKKYAGMEMDDAALKRQAKDLADRQALTNLDEGVSLGQLGKLGLGAASAHPFLTGAGALTGGMNLAGLMDNDKFGGQLGGLALGGLASYGLGLTPGYAYLATTAGGALGSLFDKLRAKREAESQQAQMYQQAYR
jgi:hypothetical protein